MKNGHTMPLKLSKTVGGLAQPPTKRAKIGSSIWFDLINPNPANALFRARTRKFRGSDSATDLLNGVAEERDSQDRLRDDLLEIVYECFVADWGTWDEDGNATALRDDDGEMVPCTLDNFKAMVQEVEGGEYLFTALIAIVRNSVWFKVKQTAEEKNSLRPSPRPSTAPTARRTRKSPRAARASNS